MTDSNFFEGVVSAIESSDGVEFGKGLGPSAQRILETEKTIRTKLPPSYLWFLGKYSGGYIFGDEIYSIYESFSEFVPSGDISYQSLRSHKAGILNEKEIPIMENDYGQTYFMQTLYVDESGEYPIYVKHGKLTERYADNFAEFLMKQISENLS